MFGVERVKDFINDSNSGAYILCAEITNCHIRFVNAHGNQVIA